MYGDSVILRAARRPSSGPSAGTGAAIAGSLESSSTIEIDVRRRAAVAFPLDADLIRLRPDPARHDDPRTELVVGVGRSPDEVRDDRDGVVVVGSGSLGDRLDRVARWSDDGLVIGFEVDPFRKDCLLNGWDDIGLVLRHADRIREYEAKRLAEQPWLARTLQA